MRAAGMEPDQAQRGLLTTPGNQLALCHRQFGKSWCFAAKGLEVACRKPGALILLVSRSMRQSGELFRKVKQFYNITHPLPLVKDTELGLELSNGSRILSLPGSEETIVGFSAVDLLVMDEAARIPDATYYAVRPMLAMSNGAMIAASTPFGQRGWFWEAFQNTRTDADAMDLATVERLLADLHFPDYTTAEPSEAVQSFGLAADTRDYAWTRTRVTAPENPRITRRFLAHERLVIPDLWWRQEWLCEFVALGSRVFTESDIALLLSGDVQPLRPLGHLEHILTDSVTALPEIQGWHGNPLR